MKKQIFYVVLFLIQGIGLSQEEEGDFSASGIKNQFYYVNPFNYLKNIDESYIPTRVLIDREPYGEIILAVDGFENSTTIDFKDWLGIFRGLRFGHFDTNYVSSIDSFEYVANLQYRHNRTYPIGIMDYEFNRIKQAALDNGELMETDEGLFVNEASLESFSTHRAVISGVMSHHIFGDAVSFYIGDFYNFSNISPESKALVQVEIDFGNGDGFQAIELNSERLVQYGTESGFVHMITRLTYQFVGSEETEQVYAHSTFFRTGSSTVPMPDELPIQNMATKTDIIDPSLTGFYPEPVRKWMDIVVAKGGMHGEVTIRVWREDYRDCKIEYNILYSPQNTEENKLRRPIIICDGFDPGNQRDYFATNKPYDEYRLDKDADYRGLYELINGNPSPWYSGQPSANLITKLRNDGYDIIVVNFLNGAGDIIQNAGTEGLRGFLNDVINGPVYRDNKTEEAVLIGPSMGGIITRLALVQMQEADPVEDPFVKMWISFDSPQKGANIAIGVQHTIEKLAEWSKDDTPLNALKTTAAKQMLLSHFQSYGSGNEHSSLFDHLYDDLLQDKYPVYSKNYAISNGGKSKLFENTTNRIAYFQPKLNTKWGYYFLLTPVGYFWFLNSIYVHGFPRNQVSGYRDLMVSYYPIGGPDIKGYSNQIGYDNAPGGWFAVPYLINYHKKNRQQQSDDSNIRLTRSTFMTTTSAFGIEADYGNVYNTWEDYTGRIKYDSTKFLTPFDEVYGMSGICEEHVRISEKTGEDIINKMLHPEFRESERPRNRLNATINQQVNGPVAYTAKEKYTFGGNGNTYTVQSNANLNIKAGEEIVLLPGFSTEEGAYIMAEITTIDYTTVFMKTNGTNTQAVDYTQQSPYLGLVFNYGAITGIGDQTKYDMVSIYPNPVKNELNLEVKGVESCANLELQIFSSNGKLVYSGKINTNQQEVVNVTTFAQGVYYCKILSNKTELCKAEFVKVK